MSHASWEAYDRIHESMKALQAAMSYLPHRFGKIHKSHDQLARTMGQLVTNFSHFEHMFDGEPTKATKDFKSIRKRQRHRVRLKKTSS